MNRPWGYEKKRGTLERFTIKLPEGFGIEEKKDNKELVGTEKEPRTKGKRSNGFSSVGEQKGEDYRGAKEKDEGSLPWKVRYTSQEVVIRSCLR